MMDVLQAGAYGGGTYVGDGVVPRGSSLRWGAEFASVWYLGGEMMGTQESPVVHDFTLTYLLPTPVQLERREIDF